MMSRCTKSKIPKKVKSPAAPLHGDPAEVSPERGRDRGGGPEEEKFTSNVHGENNHSSGVVVQQSEAVLNEKKNELLFHIMSGLE